MSAKWPTSIAADADLYVAVNSLQTTLSTALGTSDTSVVLASATGFPVAGGVTIGNEVIFYTGVSGATLTGCTRGADGTTAASHSVGVPVGAAIIAFHHNGLMAEIEAIESSLNLTANRAVATNSSGRVIAATTTDTELGYVHGVTSAIQTQLGLLAPLASPTFTGTVTVPSLAATNGTNQLVLGTTRTVTVTAPIPATSSRTWTIPDITGNGTFAALEGTQTFSGAKTFSGGVTLSGSTIAMGANKITGLANGTAASDAAAFGQIKVLQTVVAVSSVADTTTSSTYASTSLAVTITPTSASNRILLFVSGLLASNASNISAFASIFRGSTNLATGANVAMMQIVTISGGATYSNGTMIWLDSPATTSAVTYTIKIKNSDNATIVRWGNGNDTSIVAMEVV